MSEENTYESFILQYNNLQNTHDQINQVIEEEKAFLQYYQSQSLLSRQFDMKLNLQKTEYITQLQELRDVFEKQKILTSKLWEFAFYSGYLSPEIKESANYNNNWLRHTPKKVVPDVNWIYETRYLLSLPSVFSGSAFGTNKIKVDAVYNRKYNDLVLPTDIFTSLKIKIKPNTETCILGTKRVHVTDVSNRLDFGNVVSFPTRYIWLNDEDIGPDFNGPYGSAYLLEGFTISFEKDFDITFKKNVRLINQHKDNMITNYPLLD